MLNYFSSQKQLKSAICQKSMQFFLLLYSLFTRMSAFLFVCMWIYQWHVLFDCLNWCLIVCFCPLQFHSLAFSSKWMWMRENPLLCPSFVFYGDNCQIGFQPNISRESFLLIIILYWFTESHLKLFWQICWVNSVFSAFLIDSDTACSSASVLICPTMWLCLVP